MKKKSADSRRWKNPLHVDNAGAARLSECLLRGNNLREKVQGGWALGTFLIEVPTPATLFALALAGFDFVVIDLEHSSIGFAALEMLIPAGHAAGLTILVRTWGEDSGQIGKVLDMGAHGIMAPHVDSAERAREIVDQARFKPRGNRGFSPLAKFAALQSPLEMLGEATYVVVQIEGREALQKAAEIAAVPGVDAVFVGPYDLALSLDVQPGSPEVERAAVTIAETLPKQVTLGIYIDDPATCAQWAARRYALQCVSFDGRMLVDAARRLSDQARQGFASNKSRR